MALFFGRQRVFASGSGRYFFRLARLPLAAADRNFHAISFDFQRMLRFAMLGIALFFYSTPLALFSLRTFESNLVAFLYRIASSIPNRHRGFARRICDNSELPRPLL